MATQEHPKIYLPGYPATQEEIDKFTLPQIEENRFMELVHLNKRLGNTIEMPPESLRTPAFYWNLKENTLQIAKKQNIDLQKIKQDTHGTNNFEREIKFTASIYSLQHTDSFISLTNKVSSAAFGTEDLVDKDVVNYFTSTAQLCLSIDHSILGNNGYATLLASSINFVDKHTNLFDYENQFTKCIVKGTASSILTASLFSPAAGAINAASSTAQCLITENSPEITSTLGVLSPIFNLLTQENDRNIAEKITDVVRIADIATEVLTVEYVSESLESVKNLSLRALGYTHTDEM